MTQRINPGDREHRLTTIKKVTSGSTAEIAAVVDALYQSTALDHRSRRQ
jgi:UDP-N-acetyl-D-galactosamine dehydrogenase